MFWQFIDDSRKRVNFAENKLLKRNTMKSVAYNGAMDYALEVLKAVKESGYEMDYPLEQFVNVSIRIGADLARAEVSLDPEDQAEEYKEAERNAYRSIYWGDISARLKEYDGIPFESYMAQTLPDVFSEGTPYAIHAKLKKSRKYIIDTYALITFILL